VAADAAGQADRDRLALLSRLAPLDDKATDMRVADKAATVAEAAHAACEQDAAAAARSSMDAARALQRAMQADTQAAADLAVLEPIWREADAIDRELAAAETALTESRRQAAGAAEAVRKSEVMLTTLIAEAAGCQRERDKLATDFTSDSIQSRFAERAAEVEDLFERRLVLAGAKSAALAEARHSEADLVKLVQAADTDQARLTELKAAQADIAAELENVRARWRDADAGRIEVRARAVDAIQGVVDEVLELANGWVEAGDEISTATDIIDATDDRLTQAEARRRHADTELDRATAARREVGHLADLAAATASEAAGGLRAHLRPGQPCPVCGGSDHPYAHNADASVRIVATMLGRRDALDQQIDTLTQSVAEARGELAAATVERDDAVRRRTEALEIQDGIVALFPEKRETLEAALAEHAWEHALPFQLDAAMPAEVLALADKVQLVRNEVMHARDEIAELRMALDELQAQADAIAAEREAVAQRVEQSSARRQTAERFRLVADNKVQQANAALAVITLSLTPYLEGAQLSVLELDRDPAGVRARFKALTAAHAASRVKLGELDKRLQELAVQIAKASAERDNAIGLASTVSTRVVESESLAVQRRSDRAKLLDGMPTAEHRARHLAAREAAQKARVEADAAQRDSALEHVRHIERTLASRAVLDAAIAQRNEARARFTQALAAAGIADPQALDVVRLSPDAVASLEAAVASKARAAADATTTLALRQTDLSAALAAGQVERADAEIAKQVAERETQVIELEAARARAVARLTLDDETRRKAGALTADIEAAKAELDTWSAVDEAIGSASGDKFCRFAQGITLDHLVRLANGQLDLIAPRYRLTRMDAGDLALAVIDRDMGDEVRGVRSLSGGERFLVSLALALALSGLEGRQAFVDTLFIDEGFGALDAETLETAVAALEALHGQGRRVGVVTHVAAMIDRIAVQICVEKRGQGRSEVRLRDGTSLARAA
jgi:exonuclease SbcC